MQPAYKPCELRNTGEAFRRFRTAGALAAAHEFVTAAVGRKLTAGLIALIGTAALIGLLITFWPR
jgi:hypothetical protein